MKRTLRSLGFYLRLALICGMIGASATSVHAANCSALDNTAPTISITAPTSAGVLETEQSTLTLSGDMSENCGIKSVTWTVNGEEGGTTSGETDNWSEWSWRAEGIQLDSGLNHIVVTAEDTAGNLGAASIDVTYTTFTPPPPPPIGETALLEAKKAKFTFYFGGSSYEDIDRFSVVGYLIKDSDEEFIMPFDRDVTVMVHVPGYTDPIFSQTIPAGTVSGTTKYRYTGSPGIRELTFQSSTSTSVYLYVYVSNTNFLPELRDQLTPEAYQAEVQKIDSFTLTIMSGSDKVWQGTAPLVVSYYSTHKQELHYNR